MTQPKILTIILNYKTPNLIVRATDAALREMQGLDGEVLVVDNGSADGSFEQLSQAAEDRGWTVSGRVRVVSSGRNGGFGAGVNFGIRTGLADGSAPDFYYLLNSDAWPDPGAVGILRDFLMNTPQAGFAGSGVRGTDDDPHRTAFRFPTAAGEFEAAARTGVFSKWLSDSIVAFPIPQTATRVDWTAGASLMIRREMLDQVGLFDETFFLYYEETELCHRALLAGWECWYLPESRVAHVGSASTGLKSWTRTPGYWFDSRRHYFTKCHGTAGYAWATITRVAGTLIWKTRRLLQNKPQADPDHFLKDLIAHSLRPNGSGMQTSPPQTGATQKTAEDSK